MSNEGYMEGPGKGVFDKAPDSPGKNYGAAYQTPGQAVVKELVVAKPPSGLTPEQWNEIRKQSVPAEY